MRASAGRPRARSSSLFAMGEHYRVGVLGATGAVGGKVLEVLDERQLPIGELVPFASARSEGKLVRFGGAELPCRTLSAEAVEGFDFVFSAAGGSASLEWGPRLA